MNQKIVAACVMVLGALGVESAKAVLVTVTANAAGTILTPEVVFNSGGYETETVGVAPSSPSPAGASYSLPLFGAVGGSTANNNSNVATVTGAATGGPSGAFGGTKYVAVNRVNGTIGQGSNFARSINLATESFKFEYAFWGTTNAMAFAIGNNVANSTVTEPGVLAGWRYNSTASDLTQYLNSIQDDGPGAPGGIADALAAKTYLTGAWNTLVYSWDFTTQTGTYTLNGESAAAAPRVAGAGASQAAPTTVNRFFASAGANNTTVWMDTAAVPEPASLGLVGAAGALLLARRRRN